MGKKIVFVAIYLLSVILLGLVVYNNIQVSLKTPVSAEQIDTPGLIEDLKKAGLQPKEAKYYIKLK